MNTCEYRAGTAAHGDVVERNARLPVEHYSVHIGLSVDRKADRSAGTAEITGIAVKPVVELRFVQDEGVGSGHRCRFYRGTGQECDLTEAGSVGKVLAVARGKPECGRPVECGRLSHDSVCLAFEPHILGAIDDVSG